MRTTVPRAALALLWAFSLLAAGCGRPASGSPGGIRLTVLAAASLTNALPQIGRAFTRGHPGVSFDFSFAGTDQVVAQIRQGAPADVFAGASASSGDALASARLIEPPVALCTNRLVMITPASDPAGINGLADLATRPVKLVIGAATVPVGTYTRTVLASLEPTFGPGYAAAVLRNVVSNEDSVTSILAKVRSGEADAGFVYVTDALGAGAAVRTFDLPAASQAVATYPVAVVAASPHPAQARAFVRFALSPAAQRLLRGAGFGPRPSPAVKR